MIMPFSDNIVKTAYDCVVKPVFDRMEIKIRKADEIWTVNPLYDDIIKEIQVASVVVVDISGKNPNVFYELGVAHTIKQQKTIILTHDEFASTPFDVAHFRIIKYADTIESSKRLEKELESTIKTITSDRLDDNLEEFEAIHCLFVSENRLIGAIYDLLFLSSQDGVISKKTGYDFSDEKESFGIKGGLVKDHKRFPQLQAIGYISEDEKNYYITDKGRLFVRFIYEIKKMPQCMFKPHEIEKR
jgi:hypothetical protein